jgi:hypothetical protein
MKAYQLKLVLIDSNPIIWRRLVVPAEITFQRLHDVIQSTMSWQNYHMFEFQTPDDKFRFVGDQETINEFNSSNDADDENPKWKYKLASKTKIDSLLNKHKALGYVYDFGDFWQIEIKLEATAENHSKPYATCLDGENSAPPEDVGGMGGFAEFLEAYRKPENDQHDEMVEWCDGWRDEFSKRSINARLRQSVLNRVPAKSSKTNKSKAKRGTLQEQQIDNVINMSSPRAKWLALPQNIRDLLLKNGYCSNCGDVTEIVDFTIYDKNGLIIEGKCKKCGGKVVRCVE